MHFAGLLRPPTRVDAQGDGSWTTLTPASAGIFGGEGVEVTSDHGRIAVRSRGPLRHLRLRWSMPAPSGWRYLGDAWERGYGDLEWRGLAGERPMPWYVLAHDGHDCHGFGVATGAAAFAAWHVDDAGVTLALDCRCGGEGVRLDGRRIDLVRIVVHDGSGQDEHASARSFCAALCPQPLLPDHVVYGVNDWYYAYGINSRAGLIRDAGLLAGWTAGLDPRPYLVIDDGWAARAADADTLYSLVAPKAAYGDLGDLARSLRGEGVRPGLWIRPLQIPEGVDHPALLRAPHGDRILDPSRDETLALVDGQVRHLAATCGYDLLKHDFTTFDCLGRWGFQMGPSVTADGWAFADRSRTTAEILRRLYRCIRQAAGSTLILGCNTVGHLAAGLEQLQRTGDDTSGRFWERTRKMGPNTLAMRMPQQGTFFVADADCVGLTTAIPWANNRAWLEAVAASGTALFVSPQPEAVGPEQAAALKQAFARAASAPTPAVALDWRDTTAPNRWRTATGECTWTWADAAGALGVCPP